jgi:archaellum component FlaC
MKAFVFTLFLVELLLIGLFIWFVHSFNEYKKLNNGNIETLKEGLKTHKNSINRLTKSYEEIQKAVEEAYSKLEKIYSAEKNGNKQDVRDIMNALSEIRKISKK